MTRILYPGTRALLLAGAQYNPVTALGSDLLAYWDARRSDLITIATGVSSWADIVSGLALTQATGANQPIWSPSSFNGDAALTFDGVQSSLAVTLSGQLPAAAVASELWVLAQQDALAADATNRAALGYGNSGTTDRELRRTVTTGVNRGRTVTGDGAAGQTANGTTVDLSTRHVIRGQFGASQTTVTIDGTDTGQVSVVPSTTATRLRIGASVSAAATLFWNGKVAAALVTNPLDAGRAAALQNWLLSRRRL